MYKKYLALALFMVFALGISAPVLAHEHEDDLSVETNTDLRVNSTDLRVKANLQVKTDLRTRSSTTATTTERDMKRAEMDQKREAMRLEFEAKRASSTERRVEWQQDIAKRKVEHVTKMMLATVERLEKIIVRIESRITKIKAAGGSTVASEGYIALAKADLANAKTSITAFAAIDLSSDKAQENFERIRTAASQARELIRSAHRNLMMAIRSLPAVKMDVKATTTTTVQQLLINQNKMDPQQNNVNTVTPEMGKTGSSAGPIIGIVIILAIVILGGLYFWGQRNDLAEMGTDAEATDQSIENINYQGTSDDTSSIEADLDATDVETLDAEINAS